MAFQILLNFFLAFLWMFLTGSFSTSGFLIGYLIGAIVIFLLRRFFPTRFYLARVWAIFRLIMLFLYELIKANVEVLIIVLRPKMDLKPGIFKYDTKLQQGWEVTLLSLLITLTPGTLVVDVSDDNKSLYIHALNASDIKGSVSSIREGFEKAIMEVSR